VKKTICSLITSVALMMPLASNAHDHKGPKDFDSLVDVALEVNSEGSPFAGSFDTLIALLTEDVPGRAEILSTLSGRGQFTVFAPTDDAFENLADTALTLGYCSLGDLDPAVINAVLLYHVAHGRRYAADVLDSDQIRMISGGFLKQDSAVLTDNLGRTSNLIPGALNVEADNGIIHAMDAVVLPLLPDPGPGGCL